MIGESHENPPAVGDVSRGMNVIRWGHKFVEKTDDQPAKWVFEYALVPPGVALKDVLRERPTLPDTKTIEAALTDAGCKTAVTLAAESVAVK